MIIEHIYALGFQDEVQFEFREKLKIILEERAREDEIEELEKK